MIPLETGQRHKNAELNTYSFIIPVRIMIQQSNTFPIIELLGQDGLRDCVSELNLVPSISLRRRGIVIVAYEFRN